MKAESAYLASEITRFYETFLMDLPLATIKRMFGARDGGFQNTAWRAYDSWIGLTNEAANRFYATPTVADSGQALGAEFPVLPTNGAAQVAVADRAAHLAEAVMKPDTAILANAKGRKSSRSAKAGKRERQTRLSSNGLGARNPTERAATA
jgi:hypothetical protein